MITKIIIDHIQSPTFDGVSFGEIGQYEKLVGRAFGELDPESSLNTVITDLALAPRNAHGKVEYVVDIYILKPVDATRRCSDAPIPFVLPSAPFGHGEESR